MVDAPNSFGAWIVTIAMWVLGIILVFAGGVTFGLTTVAGVGIILASFGVQDILDTIL